MADSLFDDLMKKGRPIMPAPQRMFDPESKAYKPFLSEFDYTPGGRYVQMGPTKTDVTGQYPKSAVIKIQPDGKATMLISEETRETDESKKRIKGKGIVRTNLFKQEAGWKWNKAPKGISSEYNPKFPVVSVQNSKQHLYAMETEYPEGVEMSRYPDKDNEPRLRPTKYKGEIEVGKKVGEINVRGKIHPVYDKLKIFGPVGAAVGLGLAGLGMSEDALAGGVDLDKFTPGDIYDFLAPLGFEIPKAGEGSDIVPDGPQFIDDYVSQDELLGGSL